MEIYSVERYASKVVQFLESMYCSDHKLYHNTQDRLRAIGSDCFRSIELISKILAEYSLSDTSEFSQNRDDIQSLVEQFSEDSAKTADQLEQLAKFVATTSTQLSTKDRKYLLTYYGRVLSRISAIGIPYRTVSDCAALLWLWYSTRFFQNSDKFKYNISNISTWIEDIVIAYGYHMKLNSTAQFMSEVNDWCVNVSKYSYPVPYAVYDVVHRASPEVATMEALCVWDILVDNGLVAELSDNLNSFQLSRYAISDRFYKLNPELTSNYVYYNDDPAFLYKYNILKGDE